MVEVNINEYTLKNAGYQDILSSTPTSSSSSTPSSTSTSTPTSTSTSSRPLVNYKQSSGKDISLLTPLISKYGECNIPAYFTESEEQVEFCTSELGKSLFRAALFLNTVFSLIFFKRLSLKFMVGFIIFHIFLYYFINNLFVGISISEWRTFQAYKDVLKNDPESSKLDTPLNKFFRITEFLSKQPINKQKIMYLILIVSFVFVWIPLTTNIAGERRFEIPQSSVGISKLVPPSVSKLIPN
jgi:hypothetical protein